MTTPTPTELRTPGVALVLNAVQRTGMSAHPKAGETVSELVTLIATDAHLNPVELQAAVERYADAQDQATTDAASSLAIAQERGYPIVSTGD